MAKRGSKKKYKVIAKVGTIEVGAKGFVKYNVNNLLLFTEFLDKKFPDWRWFNVYRYTTEGNGEQLSNFTKKNRPTHRYV